MVRQLTTAFALPYVSLYPVNILSLLHPCKRDPTKVRPCLGAIIAQSGRVVWKALYKENMAQPAQVALRVTARLTAWQWLLMLEVRSGRKKVRQSEAQNTAWRLVLVALTLIPSKVLPYALLVRPTILPKL